MLASSEETTVLASTRPAPTTRNSAGRTGQRTYTGNTSGRIVIDLEGLSFIDSSGLGVLVGGLRQARDVSGSVVLSRPNGLVLHVLELTGVIDVVEIVDAPDRPADE